MNRDIIELKKYLTIANEASQIAKKYLLQNKNLKIVSNSGRDIKLEDDFIVENIMVEHLKKHSNFPILSEENEDTHNQKYNDSYYWIIDPIDGSYNVARNIPLSCISIALWKGDSPLLGLINDFNHQTVYSAIVNNKDNRLVSDISDLSQSVLMTGFPVYLSMTDSNMKNVINKIKQFKKVRMIGSAALSLAYVATGKAEVYFEKRIKLWDIAAGISLVLANGGDVIFNKVDDNHLYDVIATNGKINPTGLLD